MPEAAFFPFKLPATAFVLPTDMRCLPYSMNENSAIISERSALLGCFMKSRRITALSALVLVLTLPALAGDSPQAPKLSKQTRLELEHLFNAELVYVRTPFPMGKDGLRLKNGVVTPNGAELEQKLTM